MTLVVIFFVGFVLAVVLGQTLKINAGLVAIVIGFILFCKADKLNKERV